MIGMEGSSSCMGVVAVVAVSSSVAIVSLQVHKRLMSDFFKKAHLRLGGEAASSCSTETTTAGTDSMGGCRLETVSRKRESSSGGGKKKVRFAEDVMEPSSNNEEWRRRMTRLMMTA